MELKEKWGLKEGWCWQNEKEKVNAKKCLLLGVSPDDSSFYKYLCFYGECSAQWFLNFSETDPNQEELKIGELAYFWDKDGLKNEMVRYSRLTLIDSTATFKYRTSVNTRYEFCSHINPLLK